METDGILEQGDRLFPGFTLRGAALDLGAEHGVAVLAKMFRSELVPTEAELARREGGVRGGGPQSTLLILSWPSRRRPPIMPF